MPQHRAKNLRDNDVALIVSIIDGWGGNLTWDALIADIELRLHSRYTRQALHKHVRIRDAFAFRKKGAMTREEVKRPRGSIELRKAMERIARLEAENARLEAENNNLLSQFARWAYNASIRGLDATYLGQALPPIDRDRTRPAK